MTTLTLAEQLRRPRWQDFEDQQDFVAALREWKAVRQAAWEPILAVIEAAEGVIAAHQNDDHGFSEAIEKLYDSRATLGRAAKQA